MKKKGSGCMYLCLLRPCEAVKVGCMAVLCGLGVLTMPITNVNTI